MTTFIKDNETIEQAFARVRAISDAELKAKGWHRRPVVHPFYGTIDEIAVDGTETPEELALFEAAAFERAGIINERDRE